MNPIAAPYLVLGIVASCALCFGLGTIRGSGGARKQCEAEKTQAVMGATQQALEGEQAARAREHQALAALAVTDAHFQEERQRADKLESDVAAAVRAGERRVQPSICAAVTAGVRRDAATPTGTDARADDGARRIGIAVAASAKADAQIRGLQAYALTCQSLNRK